MGYQSVVWLVRQERQIRRHALQPLPGRSENLYDDQRDDWTFKRGIKAPQAAGIIHSDFEKGFIRAVTMSYDDLISYGSEKAVREAGRLREEGKDYVVQDGDIMEFRFNV